MSEFLISTRKGLFTCDGDSVARAAFVGDNVTLAMVDPRGGWYAALDHGHFGVKLHRSDDRGATWTEIATPKYPVQPPDSGDQHKWSTSLVWALAPALDRDGALWCGTLPGGLFRSEDRGASWQLVEALWRHPARKEWMGGGRDAPGIHSIVVDPRAPRTIVVGISCGGVWRSRDAGATWESATRGMHAAYVPPDRASEPAIQDPHHIVQCAGQPDVWWCQHHNGIFRSTDDLATWREIAGAGPSTFGFAVVVDPADGNTAWFIPGESDQRRIPVDGKLVVTRTRDGGASFDVLSRGLPERFAYDVVFRHAFDLASDGTLAFGTTTGNVYASHDRGDSWRAISHHLPPVHAITFCLK